MMLTRARRSALMAAVIAAGASVSACSDSLPSLPKVGDLNPFKEKQAPLPGRRVAVLPNEDKLPGELSTAAAPVVLPAPRSNDTWTQPGGDANNAPGHLAYGGGRQTAWSASAGTGSSKLGRVTASPIVYDGKVFTLDADGTVSAFSTSGGSAIWRTQLKPTPTGEKASPSFSSQILSLGASDGGGGYGGGIAIDGGRIYGASGYGGVFALDPASGKVIWEKNVGVPVRAAPTAAGDRVYVITSEGRFLCLSGVDGTELWSTRGLPQQASRVMNVSPAVANDIVVVPYPSGDVVALKVSDGSAVWTESLTRMRTTSQLTALSDAASPAIDNGMVFAVGHAGRMVATNSTSGERVWSLNFPGTQTPCVAGDSVFVVDTTGQLMAVSRKDGKIQWTIKLPGGSTFAGPVLAGGNLWLTSNTGQLVGVDAATGKVMGQQDLGDPIFVAPVVAQGRMYVLTDDAKLIALN
ncbi:MAG: PQQ-binding-like beta-propeller repeat protein [Hyphomicrobiaceae bacterium]|nr:PQQ-binding-like beta-propeller repeat protein [Hyphomicrobiaceae bacterium]